MSNPGRGDGGPFIKFNVAVKVKSLDCNDHQNTRKTK